MKKAFLLILLFISLFTLFSCTDNNQNNQVDKKEYLIEGEDYIDHATTYDGDELYYDSAKWYVNTLDKVKMPDPFVYEEDGTYYIVGTSDDNVDAINCYETKDFNTYKLHKNIYNPATYNDDGGWESDSNPEIFAAELYKFDGVYYLHYSAFDDDGVRRNSVVVSDNPLGPYEPLVNEKVDGLKNPLFYNKEIHDESGKYPFRALDSTIFVDDDGQMYYYYVVGGVYKKDAISDQYIAGVKMTSPYEVDWSTHKKIVFPGTIDSNSDEVVLEWETYRDSNVKIAEAPFMIKSNGKYYMTYSVNGCWNKYYNVCYAVSDDPLGNFVKPYEEGKLWTNLLLGYPGEKDSDSLVYNQWSGFASGTGHHSFFKVGDELMIGYHAHRNRDWNANETTDNNVYTERYFAFDYVYFDSYGVPFVNGPSYSITHLPEAISGYKNIMTNTDILGENVENIEAVNDNYIVDCYNLDSISNEVVLGEGTSTITIEFDDEYEIGGIAIYNSAYFDSFIEEIEYIDFGNGNKIYYPQFAYDYYVNFDNEFVRPCSAFTIDILNTFIADSVTICFDLPDGGSINEIVILGAK